MKPELGVCYYPEHWPEEMWANDARRMYETGIRWVRVGEFAWSRLEPVESTFEWEWLDRAIKVLGDTGLRVVMGTPSATPPRWIVDKFPDMLPVDADGNPRKFGSRRHYDFAHEGYRELAAKMAGAMAQRYGRNPHIAAWQIDNEYGCHDTTVSYSPVALQGFRNWLAQKYQSPDALNRAWGNVFWSMEYREFDEIDLPNQTVTEANPSHWLDFRRFASEQVAHFNDAQIAAMRPHTDAPMIHNYMGRVTDFDHFAVGRDLEIASWDSYPMGFLEQVLHEETEEWKAAFSQQGDPDFQAFHHDLYRAVGKGRWWIMEQQPGPVNWAPYNPIPLDGMVKLWSMEAVAHGAEVVSYFRWRQAPFAQEQMHAGLLRPDGEAARAQIEAREVFDELAKLGEIKPTRGDVAIVFDYESQWAWEIQPQGQGFDYFRLVFEQYRALRKLGLSIDILPANTRDFGDYPIVFVPGLMAMNDDLLSAIKAAKGAVFAGPRTASKTADMQIPNPMALDWSGVTVARVGSLRPNVQIPLANGGNVIRWIEELDATNVVETTNDGKPILVAKENVHYLGGWLDAEGYARVFGSICAANGVTTRTMSEGVRVRKTKDRELVMNYNSNAVKFDGTALDPAGYVWRSAKNGKQ